MKMLFLLSGLTCFSIFLHAQIFLSHEQQENMIRLFNEGTKYLENGGYRTADSLFTLSIKIKGHANNYFNRGIARLNLKDTCGYCHDMLMSAKFPDSEARMLAITFCQKSDTFYFDKKFRPVAKDSYFYYESRSISRCTTDTLVELHGKNAKEDYVTVYLDIFNIKFVSLDLMAQCRIKNGKSRYFLLKDEPEFWLRNRSLYGYIVDNVKIPYEVRSKIVFTFLVTAEGKISEIKILPEDLSIEYQQEIARVLYSIQVTRPARVLGKPVDYEYHFNL
jgi:hypothetical protein